MLDFGMTFLVELNFLQRNSSSTELKVLISKPRDEDIRLFKDLKIFVLKLTRQKAKSKHHWSPRLCWRII